MDAYEARVKAVLQRVTRPRSLAELQQASARMFARVHGVEADWRDVPTPDDTVEDE